MSNFFGPIPQEVSPEVIDKIFIFQMVYACVVVLYCLVVSWHASRGLANSNQSQKKPRWYINIALLSLFLSSGFFVVQPVAAAFLSYTEDALAVVLFLWFKALFFIIPFALWAFHSVFVSVGFWLLLYIRRTSPIVKQHFLATSVLLGTTLFSLGLQYGLTGYLLFAREFQSSPSQRVEAVLEWFFQYGLIYIIGLSLPLWIVFFQWKKTRNSTVTFAGILKQFFNL